MKRTLLLVSLYALFAQAGCETKGEEKKEVKTNFLITSPVVNDTLITKEYVCQVQAVSHIEMRAQERGCLQKNLRGRRIKRQEGTAHVPDYAHAVPAEQQKAKADFAEIEYKNTKSLADSNIVSKNELTMAKAKLANAELTAAKIDVQVARANFYPSLGLNAELGLRAFNPIYLAKLPESLLASLIGDMVGPLVNKNALQATYYSANARQIQAIYGYERTVLNAYIEVLLTQRDALESRFDLTGTKMQQMNAAVNVYRALGGGWN